MKMDRKNSQFLIIAGGALLIAIIAYLFLQNSQLQQKLTPPTPPDVVLFDQKPTESSETANWKTYDNTLLDISLKYPTYMTINEFSDKDSVPDVIGQYRIATIKTSTDLNRQTFAVLVSYFNSPLSIDSWYQMNKNKLINPDDEVTQNSVLLGGQPSIEQIRKNKKFANFISHEVFVSYKNRIIEIGGSSITNIDEQKTFDRILSTFQFTN